MNQQPWNQIVLTVGETLLRFSPPGRERLEQTDDFRARVAGAESNFAIALQPLGMRARWVSAVPRNPLGAKVLRHIRGFGVDVSQVIEKPDARQGLFFLEGPAAPRPLEVFYDRANSAASQLGPEDMRDEWLEGVGHLHLTGITPALSDTCRDLAEALIVEARRRGLSISFDLNYRRGLWKPQDAAACLEPLLGEVDVLIAKDQDLAALFDCTGTLEDLAVEVQERFECDCVAITGGTGGSALADGEGAVYAAPAHEALVVDKLGAGDAFSAGIVCGYLKGNVEYGLKLGQALAAWKYSIPGDDALYRMEEIERLMSEGPENLRR